MELEPFHSILVGQAPRRCNGYEECLVKAYNKHCGWGCCDAHAAITYL